MKTIDIKGKQYVTVNERLKYFWENYKGWSIGTRLVEYTPERVLFEATIIDDQEKVRANGHAYEEYGSTFINKTSYVENCETSAIGRALGNLGIGIDTSVASAEEVLTAQANQEKKMYDKICGACDKNFRTSYEKADVCWNCKQAGKKARKPLTKEDDAAIQSLVDNKPF